jgi:Tfp pilus assembly protein PilP
VAVVWQTGNAKALIQDPSGDSHVVSEGSRIGKNEGYVVTIEDNMVRVKETYVDFLGQRTTKDIELSMRRNEGG